MDMDTYEEVRLPRDNSWAQFLKEGTDCNMVFFNGDVISVEPPLNMVLKVVQTDPGIKGNSATAGTKPATLETGAIIQASPLHLRSAHSPLQSCPGRSASRESSIVFVDRIESLGQAMLFQGILCHLDDILFGGGSPQQGCRFRGASLLFVGYPTKSRQSVLANQNLLG
jgi:hypothetical protein